MDGPFFNFAGYFTPDISYLELEIFFHIFLVMCSIKLGKYHESNVVSVADNTC